MSPRGAVVQKHEHRHPQPMATIANTAAALKNGGNQVQTRRMRAAKFSLNLLHIP